MTTTTTATAAAAAAVTTTTTTIKKEPSTIPVTTFRALIKAVGIWTLMYVSLALLLALWKIQTPVVWHHGTTTTTTTNEGQQLQLLFQTRIHQLEMAIQQSQERNHILQARILERQTFHQRVQGDHTTNHTNEYRKNPTDYDDDESRDNNDVVLQRLLSWYPKSDHNAQESSSSSLRELLPLTITTLAPAWHSWTSRHDWDRIQTLWDAMNHHHHHHVVDHTEETELVGPTTTSPCATHELLQSRLRHWQTHELFWSTTSTVPLLPKLPLSWPSSRRDMQLFLQQTWNDTIQSQQVSAGTSSSGTSSSSTSSSHVDLDDDDDDDSTLAPRGDEDHNPNCLPSHDWLEEFINVGWDALQRDPGLDVRRDLLLAIHQRASSSSPPLDVSNVRLDIPSFVTTYHVHAAAVAVNNMATGATFDNLRQYLDRPCMYELSIYLDVLLDYISGRHEILDDFMDQYIYNNPHFTSSSSSSLRLPTRNPSTTLMGPRLVASLMNDVLGRLPMIPLSSSSSLFANSTNWTRRLVSAVRSTMGNTATPHIP